MKKLVEFAQPRFQVFWVGWAEKRKASWGGGGGGKLVELLKCVIYIF